MGVVPLAGRLAWALLALALCVPPPATADFIVPSGALVNLNGAVMDLGCTDVIVAGTLQLGSGQLLNVRHVDVQAGGALDGGSGSIDLGGNWSAAGGFLAATSTVRFRDLCSLASATVSGNSTFAGASFVTTSGKNYVFAVGSTQTVTGVLQISGTLAQPIQFRSSTPGQVAFINLTGTGTQQIQHVGVTDVWATGQWLAPGQQNEGGGGNANRWFGQPASPTVPVPALSDFALSVLSGLLAAMVALDLRRRRTRPAGSRNTPGHPR